MVAVMAGFGFRCWKKWLPACAFFALMFFVTIAPVTLHNVMIGKDFVLLTSNAGPNLFIGNNAHSKGIYMNSPRYKGRPMGLSIRDQQANFPAVAKQELGRDDLKPSEVSRFWTEKTVEEIRSDVGRWLRLEANKLQYLTNAYEVPNNYNYYFWSRFSTLLQFPLVTFGVIFPLAVAGVIISVRRWREQAVPCAFLLAQVVGLLAFFVTARYRLVMVPVLLVYVGAVVVWTCQWLVCRRGWRLALLVILLIPGYALAFQEVTRSGYFASYVNLANAYRDLGQPDEALANYDRAISLSPNYHYTYLKKGEVLARLGRKQQARETLNRALVLARRSNDSLNVRRIEQQLRRLDEQ
jgi:tetratricopeptide (TPR) repeat protein